MNLRDRKQALVAEINITPFTDVILVLLIIFMITTPLLIQSSIKVNLPKAGSAKSSEASDQVNITVTDKSVVYVDGTEVSKSELKEKISAMYKRNPSLKVMLFSDKSARFADVVMALDVLNAIGIRDLNIAAKTTSKE